MSAQETLNLISKQWCNLNELMQLTALGRNNALKVRKAIKDDLTAQGYLLPKNLLPMNEVVNYLKINVSYLKKMSN